jgi:hypothetical protein
VHLCPISFTSVKLTMLKLFIFASVSPLSGTVLNIKTESKKLDFKGYIIRIEYLTHTVHDHQCILTEKSRTLESIRHKCQRKDNKQLDKEDLESQSRYIHSEECNFNNLTYTLLCLIELASLMLEGCRPSKREGIGNRSATTILFWPSASDSSTS